MSQINRPKAHRPELVNTETPISQEQKMRQALGLGKEDGAGSGDDEPESPTPVPPKPKKSSKSAIGGQSDNDQLIKELQGKNAELEKRLSTEGSRKDEQVGPTCK
jgi:hypothetical protein